MAHTFPVITENDQPTRRNPGTVPPESEPGPETVARLVARMAALPSLSSRYRGLTGARLSDLPVLTKEDLRRALADSFSQARKRPDGALVLGSGGTTSEPKLSLMPSGQFVADLRDYWDPLRPSDVLINCDVPGRLCSSHNFFNMLAHESGAIAVPLGAVGDAELGEWLDFAQSIGATALNATQSHIAHMLDHCLATGRTPPDFRTVLWTGEPFSQRALAVIRQALPEARLYGVYGSTETWVIGYNGPQCGLDVFHRLPYQHVEISDGQILITTTHPSVFNPIVRYQIGDRGEFVPCPCGKEGPCVRVLGRDDPQVKFLSVLVTPSEIAGAAAVPGVTGVQVALIDHGLPQEKMEVRLLTAGDEPDCDLEDRARAQVLRQVYRLGFEVASEPGAFAVRVVPRLTINSRSGKTPLLVREAGRA